MFQIKNLNDSKSNSNYDVNVFKAELFDNIQFIYELSLADLELKSLNFDFSVSEGLRDFFINNVSHSDLLKFIKRISYFQSIYSFFSI